MSAAHSVASHRRRSPTTPCHSSAVNSAADMLPESTVFLLRRTLTVALFFATVSLSFLVLVRDFDSFRFLSRFPSSYSRSAFPNIFPSGYNDSFAVSSITSCSSFELWGICIFSFCYDECNFYSNFFGFCFILDVAV